MSSTLEMDSVCVLLLRHLYPAGWLPLDSSHYQLKPVGVGPSYKLILMVASAQSDNGYDVNNIENNI